MLASWKESYDKIRQHIIKQRHCFADQYPYNQNYGFSSSHVWRWVLNHKEVWAPKNWCFWIVMLEKTLESPLDSKEIKTFNPKGNQSWILVGWTVGKGEASLLWPPDGKSQLIGANPDAGKDWRQREKGVTEDKMDWWHGITDPMGIYLSTLLETVEDRGAWCDIIQCHKELDMTLWLNSNHGESYVSPM